MRRELVNLAIVAVVAIAGCDPAGFSDLGPVSRKNELRIENNTGAQLSRVTVKWSGDDLVWEKSCTACQGRGEWAGKPCEVCKGTGSAISTRDRNIIFKLPIRGKTDTTFRIEAVFLDGSSATFEHQTSLNPEERKRITAAIGKDRKFTAREKKRNPHIE